MNLNILIIGAGMYVCGRGTNEYGTILPALCEYQRQNNPLGRIFLASTHYGSIPIVEKKLNKLNRRMGTNLSLTCFPQEPGQDDKENYKKALEEIPRPAAAIVVVPDQLHAKIATDCLNAGLHTLIVKPMTPDLKSARQLIALQKKTGLYGAVEFHKRFDRANLKLKEALASGKLGKPLYFIVEYSQRKSIPAEVFTSWVDQTNIFQYLGVHYVDIIYFVTGARPKRAMAIGQYGWLRQKGIDGYDAVHGIIEWETAQHHRFISMICTNWIDPESTSAMSDQKIKVIGTNGRYESDQKRRGITIVSDDHGIEEPNPDFCSAYPAGPDTISYQGYGIQSVKTFVEDTIQVETGAVDIKTLEALRPCFKDCLVSTAVIEAINNSLLHHGEWQDITLSI